MRIEILLFGGGGGGGVRRPSQPFDDHVGQILPENDHGRDGRHNAFKKGLTAL